GTTILVREQTPAPIVGVEWGEAAFSGSSVTATGAGEATIAIASSVPVEVLLTNPTSQRNGQFQVTKQITGDGIDQLSGEPEFVLRYTHEGLDEPQELVVGAD